MVVAHVRTVSGLANRTTLRTDRTWLVGDGTVGEGDGFASDILHESIVDQRFRSHELCDCKGVQREYTPREYDVSETLC